MDFSISAGDAKDVSVLLDNETLYVAFQFDLYLPTGISLAGYEVNSERVPASTEVSMAQQEDGSYRFLAAAMAMEPIFGNNGGIIKTESRNEYYCRQQEGISAKCKVVEGGWYRGNNLRNAFHHKGAGAFYSDS